MAEYRLQIITQEKIVFDRDVVSAIIPGAEGYFGVLAHHAPLVAAIGSGRLCVKGGLGRQIDFDIEGGFFEFSSNIATILADRLSVVAGPEDEGLSDGDAPG
jgi:F-type H+-transporting ATPase subunit epsilon